jgi:hypothetical protein
MTGTFRIRHYRPILLVLAPLMIIPLLIGCIPCDCDVTPPGGEEVIPGQTGPKTGDQTLPNPDLPAKGDDVGPIGGEAGDKPAVDLVQPGDPGELVERYGDQAKPETDPIAPGADPNNPKVTLEPPRGDVTYGRLRLTLTSQGELRAENLTSIEGDIQPPTVLMGELLAVIYLDEQPVYYETFADPLVAIGFPQADEGHSYGNQTEGTILVSLPPRLMSDRDALLKTRLEIYRLDSSIAFDTPLTADTLPNLIERSQLISRITGEELAGQLDQRSESQ